MARRRDLERWAELYREGGAFMRDSRQMPSREMIIVGCAMLDVALAELISARLRDDAPGQLAEFLGTNGDGRAPLGSFGSRIQGAYLLGCIEKHDVRRLRALKAVRNAMSHRVKVSLLDREAQQALDEVRAMIFRLQPVGLPSEEEEAFRAKLRSVAEASRTNLLAAHIVLSFEIDMVSQALESCLQAVTRVDYPLVHRRRPPKVGSPEETI